jgi:hypothetical protein
MYCTYCGYQNTEDAKFCVSCGQPIAVITAATTPPSSPKPQVVIGLPWTLSTVGVILMLVGFFMPWVQACNVSRSGMDLALSTSQESGGSAANLLLLVTPIVALIVLCLLLSSMGRARLLAGLRLILAIASFIPLALFFIGVQMVRNDPKITWGMGALIQFDYGFWVSVLGFFGQLGGAIMDLKESP